MKKRILSGITPSGSQLHIGNYIFLRMQKALFLMRIMQMINSGKKKKQQKYLKK